MSQASISIANGSGASVRSALNSALEAITTLQSGATAPSTTYPFMQWADTANDLLKQRNAANSAWITKGTLSAAYGGLPASSIVYDPGSPNLLAATNVQDAIDELAASGTSPAFFAYKAASATNQAISTTTHTKVTFATEVFDVTGAYASSTFTPLTEGYYHFDAAANWDVGGSSTIEYRLIAWKNGVGTGTIVAGDRFFPNADTNEVRRVSGLVYLNGSTDFLEIGAYVSTGKSIIATDNIETYFCAHLVK